MNQVKSKQINLILLGILMFGSILTACQVSKVNSNDQNKTNGRNDAWRIIGIGGGGAMFNPAVSPFNPDFAFVSCDMGGAFVTYNGGESWRMFHLHNMVRFYVFDPLDSNTVYANALGLYKSTDKGATWRLIYPDSSKINGLVAKGDHAEEEIVMNDSSERDVLALAVDPSDSKKLYAAIAINRKTALYFSVDGGAKWDKQRDLPEGVKNIFIDPSSPTDNRSLFVTGNIGITQKVNGAWKENLMPEGVTKLTSFSAGYSQQRKRFIIYAISGTSYFNPEADESGIHFTDNGGVTWQNRQDGIVGMNMKGSENPEWRTIATSAFHPEVVYVSYNGLKISKDTTCIGVAKSEDFGKTWKLVWKDVLTKNGNGVSKNFDNDWLNERYGPTWGENPFGIGVAPANPEICFATDFGRTVKTNNGGKNWESVTSKKKNETGWTSRGLDVTTGYSIVFDPFDKNHVFIPTTDIGLMESKDGAESWMSATRNNGIPQAWINTCYWLTFDPEVKGKAWAVMSGVHDLPRPKMFRKRGVKEYTGGILITNDAGKNWQPVSKDIGEAAMTHILLDPTSKKESRTLYACAFGKGVYKSVDGGKSWQLKNKGIEGAEPFAWQITRREKDGALFLVVSRRGEDGTKGGPTDGAIYKSVDGAENWTIVSLPVEANAPTTLSINNQQPEKLVLSAWGRKTAGPFQPEIGGGIFISSDDGKSWKQTLVKDQHIGAVTFDARNNRFYACGFTGSAYYSDDEGNSWIRIKGYNFKWGQRVEPDPRDAEKVFIITFGGGVWHGPAKGDADALEDIVNPLKSL